MNLNHLGIIVDGNGRWAKERGLSRSEGHKEGAKRLEELILYVAKEKLVNYLSLYVFSTENFGREEKEVNYLMELFLKWFKTVKAKYKNENIKVLFSGNMSLLRDEIVESIKELEEYTAENTGLVVNFCLSYGGREEITHAVREISKKVLNKELALEDINEKLVGQYMYHELPDIDFLIRTSGENRISNFMLWQISYAEFYFPKTYFPDFDVKCLLEAFLEYKKRDRRFGKIK